MSGGVSSVSNVINYASSYVETAVKVAFSTSSNIYNKGTNLAKYYSKDYPILENLLPQENETAPAAIARGIKVAFTVVLSAAAAMFAVNVLLAAVSNLTHKVVVGCVIGGLAGLAQHLHACLSAQGPAGAGVSQALQGGGQDLNARVVAVEDRAAAVANAVSEPESAASNEPAVSADAASENHANSDEDHSEFEKV